MAQSFKLKDSSYILTPFEGPLDQDPQAKFFADYGYVIAACARLEYMVTMLVIHINKEEDNPQLHDPDPSEKYSQMVRLLRKWISNHPEFEPFNSPQNETFFSSLIEYAKLRNRLVHSFVERIDPDTGEIIMHRITRSGKDEWRLVSETYKPALLEHIASQANLAARHFNEIAIALFEEVPDEQSQTP